VKLSFCLPLFSFLFGVVLSIVKDFETANRTHCYVANIFPSISASVGDQLQPQSVVWRSCIGLDSFPRYFISYVHYKKCASFWRWHCWRRRFVRVMFAFNFVELTSLTTLSYVSSHENFYMHQASFVSFIVSSYVYMAMWVVAYQWWARTRKSPR